MYGSARTLAVINVIHANALSVGVRIQGYLSELQNFAKLPGLNINRFRWS